MSLKHVAPFSADYPTLGLYDVQPGQTVELPVREEHNRALSTGMFEDVSAPGRQPAPRAKRTKTPTPVAAAAENTEGSE